MKNLSTVRSSRFGVRPGFDGIKRSQSPFWRTALAAGSVSLAMFLAARPGAALGQEIQVTSGEGVTIDQQEFELDGDPADVSSTGNVQINAGQLLGNSGLSSGYLNIEDSSGWAVQNVPVNSTLGSLTTMFNLGTADGVNDSGSGVDLSVDISANPVTSFTPTAATPFSSSLQVNDGEQGEGAAAGNPAPPAANAVSFTAGGAFGLAYEAGHPNVQAADNQCGPAALANELSWLNANYGLFIPDPNVPGRGVPGTGNLFVPNGAGMETAGNSLVGRLDIAIGRGSVSRTSGNTTTGQQQITGLMTYLGSARVNDANAVAITYQGNISGSASGTVSAGGMTANGWGASVSAGFIFSNLVAGATVKLGESTHAVDVIGSGYVLGSSWVLLSSDLAQTDVDPNDNMLGNTPVFAWLGTNNVLYGEAGNPNAINDIAMRVVPEPTSFALLGAGVFALGARRFFRRR